MQTRSTWVVLALLAGTVGAMSPAGATSGATDGRIAWSRDGDIFSMLSDGSRKRQLTESPRFESARWSPDGTMLAVRRGRNKIEQREQIVVMTGRGTDETRVGRARYTVQGLEWSPDGTRIAYCDMDIDNPDGASPYPSAIKVVDIVSKTQTRLTEFEDRACGPTWSPDGTRIAFTQPDAVVPEVYPTDTGIYVMGTGGSDAQPVIDDDSIREYEPAWSPDGETIAFLQEVQHPEGGTKEVVIRSISVDGTGLSTLTEPVDAWDQMPKWSPDGKKLLFWRTGAGPDEKSYLGVVDADGDGEELLAPANGWSDWSPDSSKITFERGGNIFVIGVDGSGLNKIAGGRAFDGAPSWQPR